MRYYWEYSVKSQRQEKYEKENMRHGGSGRKSNACIRSKSSQ